MELADLADWTLRRIRIEKTGAFTDWIDLRGIPYAEPFLLETITAAHAAGRQTVTAPLAALHLLEQQSPGRDPAGLVFHVGRCGSTLVSQAVAQIEGAVAVSEPDAINDLLEIPAAGEDRTSLINLLRLAIRALGRGRGDGAYLVKLSSFAICRADLLREAFPGVPCAFIGREPLEVIGSVLEKPPGWAQLITRPETAATLLRLDDVSMDEPEEFLVGGVAGIMTAALEQPDMLLVDYRELPGAIVSQLLSHFGITPTPADLARIAEAVKYDVKAGGKLVFVPDSARKRDKVPAEMRAMCEEQLAPLHEAIERRRLAQP